VALSRPKTFKDCRLGTTGIRRRALDVRCRKERRRMTNVLANAWNASDSSGYGQVVDLIPPHNVDGARARAVTPGTVAYCEEKPPLSDLVGRQRLSRNLTCYAEAPQHFLKAQIHETHIGPTRHKLYAYYIHNTDNTKM